MSKTSVRSRNVPTAVMELIGQGYKTFARDPNGYPTELDETLSILRAKFRPAPIEEVLHHGGGEDEEESVSFRTPYGWLRFWKIIP